MSKTKKIMRRGYETAKRRNKLVSSGPMMRARKQQLMNAEDDG